MPDNCNHYLVELLISVEREKDENTQWAFIHLSTHQAIPKNREKIIRQTQIIQVLFNLCRKFTLEIVKIT